MNVVRALQTLLDYGIVALLILIVLIFGVESLISLFRKGPGGIEMVMNAFWSMRYRRKRRRLLRRAALLASVLLCLWIVIFLLGD